MTNRFKIELIVILCFFFITLILLLQSRQDTTPPMNVPQTTPSPSIPTVAKRIDLGSFSIELPEGWRYESQTGVDSFVGTFIGDGITLLFDYGYYSNPLARDGDPKYSVTYEVIDGRKAKIVRSNVTNSGLTGIYFENVAARATSTGEDTNATTSADRIESVLSPEMPVMLGINGENVPPALVEKVIAIYRTIQFPP